MQLEGWTELVAVVKGCVWKCPMDAVGTVVDLVVAAAVAAVSAVADKADQGLPLLAALHAGGLTLAAVAALQGDHDQTPGIDGRSLRAVATVAAAGR